MRLLRRWDPAHVGGRDRRVRPSQDEKEMDTYDWKKFPDHATQRCHKERSMKPHVICHMVASVDGRTLIRRWRPEDAHRSGVFDRLHERLGGDAWLVGRITGQEYAKLTPIPSTRTSAIRGTLVHPARRGRVWRRARRARQDRLGAHRYRRRSDCGRVDRTGLRRPCGGITAGWCVVHLRR